MEADAIGKKEFWRDGTLRSFTIPEGTRLIGDWAFYGCSELIEIKIPTSIEFIGKDAFAGCDKLKRACLYGEGIPREEKSDCTEVVMAFALRYFAGQNEIVSAGKDGLKAWFHAWDQACQRFLDTSDAQGFRPFLAGGEEDYADEDREREAYCKERRLLKARIIVTRLMAGALEQEGCLNQKSTGEEEEVRLFYLEHLQQNDMALELLKETWSEPRRVVDLLEEAGVLAKDNCGEVLKRLPEECVEMKALLLQKLSEGAHGKSQEELEGLFL